MSYCWKELKEGIFELYPDEDFDATEKIADVQMWQPYPILYNPDSETWRATVNPLFSFQQEGTFDIQVTFPKCHKKKSTQFQDLIDLILENYTIPVQHFSIEHYYEYYDDISGNIARIFLEEGRSSYISYLKDLNKLKVEITRQASDCVFCISKMFDPDTKGGSLAAKDNPKTINKILRFVEKIYFPGMLLVPLMEENV